MMLFRRRKWEIPIIMMVCGAAGCGGGGSGNPGRDAATIDAPLPDAPPPPADSAPPDAPPLDAPPPDAVIDAAICVMPGFTSGVSTLAGCTESAAIDGVRAAARFANPVNGAVAP